MGAAREEDERVRSIFNVKFNVILIVSLVLVPSY
jgi:hypothetical protein